MRAIGKSKGKAKEYTKDGLSLNCYGGCGHGCIDCYVPCIHHLMRYLGFDNRQEFHNKPFPRKGIIEALKKEAPRYKGKEVFMSFTTDPYQPINQEHQLTRQCIEILHANEIAVNILTKGIITDFDLLAKRPDLSKVGVTLTNTHHATSREWEPEAALPSKRMLNLKKAHYDYGIFTWVSLEPARNLESVKRIIAYTHDYVDHYKLGKWNYDPRAKDIDWYEFVAEVIEQFEKYGCDYYIKDDLRGYVR